MSRNPSLLIPADYSPVPSEGTAVDVSAVSTLDASSLDAVAVLVHAEGDLPAGLGTDLDRAALAAAGFDGSPGSSIVVPRSDSPLLVLVGAGRPTARRGRPARCGRRGRPRHREARRAPRLHVPTTGTARPRMPGRRSPRGLVLARYRYTALRPATPPSQALTDLLASTGSTPPPWRRASRPGW